MSTKEVVSFVEDSSDSVLEVRDWRDTLLAGQGSALILTDPPYGTTQNKWEMMLDTAEFYKFAFAANDGGPVVCTSAEPFTSQLVVGAHKNFKYCWYWDKKLPTGHLNAKKQPLRQVEPIVVAYKTCRTYNPQMTADPRGHRSWHRKNTMTGSYNPYDEHTYDSGGVKYPTTLLPLYQPPKGKSHPTEKPVELMEYLIRTYTNPGDLVVDPFCGTGAVAVACKITDRKFIGGDINPEYIATARSRLDDISSLRQ